MSAAIAYSRALSRLQSLVNSGALAAIDLHFAHAVADWGNAAGLSQTDADNVILAAALTSHSASSGDVCVDLARVADAVLPFDYFWRAPPLDDWRAALVLHPAVSLAGAVLSHGHATPLVLDGQRLYLYRHWHNETLVAADLIRRVQAAPAWDADLLESGLQRLFPGSAEDERSPAWGQRKAAAQAARNRLAIISGGPGTGKTTTLAALLALIVEQHFAQHGSAVLPRILLAAPTGKAAARMQEAVQGAKSRLPLSASVAAAIPEQAQTLHRLLGLQADGRVRHHAAHPLAVDVLVVDEASMVDLTLMARLLTALPATARLVMLGDRDQLASVEAGAVYADLCQSAAAGGRLAAGYAELHHSFRFDGQRGIGLIAGALRQGDGATVLAQLQQAISGSDVLRWQPVSQSREAVQQGLAGYGEYLARVQAAATPAELHQAFARFRLLTALREGPWGVTQLNQGLSQAILRQLGLVPASTGHDRPTYPQWYAGRPVMVTRNDHALGLYNGDIGICAPDPDQGGALKVWFPAENGEFRAIAANRLPTVETAWAMTVHKSQGSEFDTVLLVMPDRSSPIVTRELVYTAVTRAKSRLIIASSAGMMQEAATRTIDRASGLAQRLV